MPFSVVSKVGISISKSTDIANVDYLDEQPCAPIVSILGDKESINFYNYI